MERPRRLVDCGESPPLAFMLSTLCEGLRSVTGAQGRSLCPVRSRNRSQIKGQRAVPNWSTVFPGNTRRIQVLITSEYSDSPERREGGIPRAKSAFGINGYSTGSVPRKRQSFNLTPSTVKGHESAMLDDSPERRARYSGGVHEHAGARPAFLPVAMRRDSLLQATSGDKAVARTLPDSPERREARKSSWP